MYKVSVTNVTSYHTVASSICRHMGVRCSISSHINIPFGPIDLFVGSQTDLIVHRYNASRAKVVYVTIEGKYAKSEDVKVARDICTRRVCVAVTKFGKALFEEQGIKVDDVMYHPIPPIDGELLERLRSIQRTFQVVYLNGHYKLGADTDCERKGWRFWQRVSSQFTSMGYITSDSTSLPNTISVKARDIEDMYKLLATGQVYANLSTHEGFGLNPVMAAYVGTKVVSWDVLATSEVLGGVDGVYFVPAKYGKTCPLINLTGTGVANIAMRWGDLDDFVGAVRYALSSTISVDYAELENKFGGHIVKTLYGYLSRR